jgi:hypothetical protein
MSEATVDVALQNYFPESLRAAEPEAASVVPVTPSRYRLKADAFDRSAAGSMSPWKLPRYYVSSPDGKALVEKIRGFDVCLVHMPNNPQAGCDEPVKSRGLCNRHIASMRGKVSQGLFTWDILEANHKALPGRKRSTNDDIFSLNDFLLDITLD